MPKRRDQAAKVGRCPLGDRGVRGGGGESQLCQPLETCLHYIVEPYEGNVCLHHRLIVRRAKGAVQILNNKQKPNKIKLKKKKHSRAGEKRSPLLPVAAVLGF